MKYNLTPNLQQIKNILLRRQKQVEQDIKNVEKEDAVMNTGLAEASEPGTDSWLADIHTRVMSSKQNLKDILGNIKKALSKINSGKFGKCEKCGRSIEESRLKAIPTATLCISCSKKTSK